MFFSVFLFIFLNFSDLLIHLFDLIFYFVLLFVLCLVNKPLELILYFLLKSIQMIKSIHFLLLNCLYFIWKRCHLLHVKSIISMKKMHRSNLLKHLADLLKNFVLVKL